MTGIKRRNFIAGAGAIGRLWGDEPADPWLKADLMEPADLAKVLSGAGSSIHLLCVGFPVLYRSKHIPHARLAGPANKDAGIETLRSAVAGLAHDTDLVIYCGCCPMKNCPNLRPAYRILKRFEFARVRVLNLPTNFHTDWVAKGYPAET